MDYYDGTKLLSMQDINGNKPEIFMCTANNTAGKTTYFSRLLVNRFLDSGDKFMIVYRFSYELDECADKFYKDIGSLFFPGTTMTAKRKASGSFSELFINDKPCGYAVSLNNVDNIVIQSNTKLYFLRKEITKLKYYISDEEMIYDKGIYYTIIKFKKGKKKYNRKELYFGPILLKNKGKVFEEYNKRELERLSLVLKMLPKNKIIDRIKTKYMISLYNKI